MAAGPANCPTALHSFSNRNGEILCRYRSPHARDCAGGFRGLAASLRRNAAVYFRQVKTQKSRELRGRRNHRPTRDSGRITLLPGTEAEAEAKYILLSGRFPKPPAGGTRIRQSFRLKAGLRTRKSGLVSLRKIFLPTKFSYPKFRGSGPGSSTRSMPTARHGPAQHNHFPD